MRKIIINADDLGLSKEVNIAIEKALEKGVVTSSTILANSECLDDVKRIIGRFPNASFGVHLNITEGRSLTNSEVFRRYQLVNSEGNFIKQNCKKLETGFIPDELKEAIKQEWDAQITLLKNHGIVPSHVDGHHHCHSWYGLTDILIELLQSHEITKVRNKYYPMNLPVSRRFFRKISEMLYRIGYNVCALRKNGLKGFELPIDSYQSTYIYIYLSMRALRLRNIFVSTTNTVI